MMQKLAKRIAKGDWEKHRRDKDLETYLPTKQDLSIAEGLILREQRIVLPATLQKKAVKLGHNLGHLRKTKQLLRKKYWFPLMNSMIDAAFNQCYKCQVAIQRRREENPSRCKHPQPPLGYSIHQPWWTTPRWQETQIPSSRGSTPQQEPMTCPQPISKSTKRD